MPLADGEAKLTTFQSLKLVHYCTSKEYYIYRNYIALHAPVWGCFSPLKPHWIPWRQFCDVGAPSDTWYNKSQFPHRLSNSPMDTSISPAIVGVSLLYRRVNEEKSNSPTRRRQNVTRSKTVRYPLMQSLKMVHYCTFDYFDTSNNQSNLNAPLWGGPPVLEMAAKDHRHRRVVCVEKNRFTTENPELRRIVRTGHSRYP
jgi:hypothetical protein